MFNYPSNIYDQSAVIPYKIEGGSIKILLIKSRKGKWIVPKGIIELGLTPQESALKESIEEAGVEGIVDEKLLGEYKYDKWGGVCNVRVFPMLVTKEYEKWEEDYFRIRKWYEIEKAVSRIAVPELIGMIKALQDLIRKNPNDDSESLH